jgi:hypothetical protein
MEAMIRDSQEKMSQNANQPRRNEIPLRRNEGHDGGLVRKDRSQSEVGGLSRKDRTCRGTHLLTSQQACYSDL